MIIRTAYDADQPFADLLNTAMVLPIFDGGNVGIRRRHMQDLMLSKNYDPWASSYGPSDKSQSNGVMNGDTLTNGH